MDQFFQHQWSTVAILNGGGMNHGFKIQTERIDRDMAFLTVDLLAGVIAVRLDWRRRACSRHRTESS